jgi:MerR family transcriptional regulator, copper efflux regulator
MRIGDLARLTGVSTSKIRFYEAQGLLPAAARLANGYRDYDGHAVAVVKFIGRARSLGFRLSEVATHLRSPRGEGRKAWLQAQLEAKLAELDAHIEEVRARRAVIAGLVEEVREARDFTRAPRSSSSLRPLN